MYEMTQFMHLTTWTGDVIFRWKKVGEEPKEAVIPADFFASVVRDLQKEDFRGMPELPSAKPSLLEG